MCFPRAGWLDGLGWASGAPRCSARVLGVQAAAKASGPARRTTGEGYLKNLTEPLNFGGLVSGYCFCVLTKP